MTSEVPFLPPGYRMRRTLCERNGSWMSLAMNPRGQFCCLKLQKIAHADSLEALADTRRILNQLTTGNAFIPLVAWGVDPPSGVLKVPWTMSPCPLATCLDRALPALFLPLRSMRMRRRSSGV